VWGEGGRLGKRGEPEVSKQRVLVSRESGKTPGRGDREWPNFTRGGYPRKHIGRSKKTPS